MREILRVETKNEAETQRFAKLFAKELLSLRAKTAIVVGLEGELGAGKTTFTKGFALGLGIKEGMKSPTFILMRAFRTPRIKNKESRIKHFLHFDAYRIKNAKEFLQIGFTNLARDPANILLIEWSDKIKKILPKKYWRLIFRVRPKNRREISLWL